MGTNRDTVKLQIAIDGEEPPREFRIFTAGQVETTKGTFIFDEESMSSVLSEYEAHGIDLMIDYDHASVSGLSLDPSQSGKAAGWFNLANRNGELWAVNVRWTPPASEALSRSEWRFMSPAFAHDKDNRITSLLNVAITNLPATRKLQPLVAASEANMMNVDTVKQALDALASGDAEAALGILKDMIASAASGDADANTEDAPPPAGNGGADEGTEAMAAAPAAKPEDDAVAASRLMRLSGATSFVDAVAEVEVWRASHLELETERATLAKERATLESAERRKLCTELVTMGAEFPATIWADPLKPSALKPRWAKLSIGDLRSHVADQKAARGDKSGTLIRTPAGPAAHGLSDRELAKCKAKGVDPAKYAAIKNQANGKVQA